MKDPLETLIESQKKKLASLDAAVKEREEFLEKITEQCLAFTRQPFAEKEISRGIVYEASAKLISESVCMILEHHKKVNEGYSKLILDLRMTRTALVTESRTIISELKEVALAMPQINEIVAALNSLITVETRLNELDKNGGLKFLKGALRE